MDMSGQRWALRCAGAVAALLFMNFSGLAHEDHDSSTPVTFGAAASTPTGATPSPGDSPSTGEPAGAPGPGRWLSGAGGQKVDDGSFARWRGEPMTVAGTWDDNDERMVRMRSFCDDWKHWNKPIDVAIGALERDKGESWAKAATGAYDARWRTTLQR